MAKKIHVIIKVPGCVPRSVHISDSLENLQKTVGGHIEAVTLATDLVILCHEEGRLLGLPHCCVIGGVDFVGTVILCGVAGEEFADVPISYQEMKRLLPQLWPRESVTNYERIKTMSVEEMAELIMNIEEELGIKGCSPEHCPAYTVEGNCEAVGGETCYQAVLSWLASDRW